MINVKPLRVSNKNFKLLISPNNTDLGCIMSDRLQYYFNVKKKKKKVIWVKKCKTSCVYSNSDYTTTTL